MGERTEDIDSYQIIENEFRIGFLEGMVEWILKNSPSSPRFAASTKDGIRKVVIEKMKRKYPNSDIERRFKYY